MTEIDLLYSFIKTRQSQCKNSLRLVNVFQSEGGLENYCLTNAKNKADESGYRVVSGWLSLPSKLTSGNIQKQFTQHWWNFDRDEKRYLDFSPGIEEGAIYIQDIDIAEYVITRGSQLSSHVASSVIMRNDKFFIIDYDATGYKYQPASDLSNQTIFSFQSLG
jgi:hypothetical protein